MIFSPSFSLSPPFPPRLRSPSNKHSAGKAYSMLLNAKLNPNSFILNEKKAKESADNLD